ncbi:MAG: hypothetical protein J5959_13255, partial [Butyrivibrio sp.]|nr:hypothetical protein [Butyrivibrio sp.]
MESIEIKAKRSIKDSVFTDIFKDPKNLLKLYKALHPDDNSIEIDDLSIVTISNILTTGIYNDLGFMAGDHLLILIEAQSTWSVNIVVRILEYLAHTYNQYFTDKGIDLYGSKIANLPKPELYVIYTGDRKERPEYISFKEEFFKNEDIPIEVKVKVIYDSTSGDILNQYIAFTKICDEQVRKYGRTKQAVEETIRICQDKNILKEYLDSRKKEVIDIMVALYDEQEILDRFV